MKIAIIGGGVTGLTAGYFLSQKNHEVFIFEKEKSLGGLSGYFKENNWDWSLEHYFHHFFSSDKEIIDLANELGIENNLFFKKPKTSVFLNDKLYKFDSVSSILRFPMLSITDKLRTLATAGVLKLNPFWKPLEKITAFSFIKTTMGKNTFNLIWEPLLVGKFGDLAEDIPASWFWTRINKRSFKLGYFNGGYKTFLEALANKTIDHGGKIFLDTPVEEIKKTKGKYTLSSGNGSKNIVFDKVISTTSPGILLKIFPEMENEMKLKIKNLQSLGALYLVLELKEIFLKDGTYWLNINDISFPFLALVEHTNFIDSENYGRNHLLYVGGYYPTDHPYFVMTKEEILKKFLPYLKKINPKFDFSLFIVNCSLFSDSYAQPIIRPNYSRSLPPVQISPEFFWTSLHHVYPQDRGVNYAVKLGREIANKINNEN